MDIDALNGWFVFEMCWWQNRKLLQPVITEAEKQHRPSAMFSVAKVGVAVESALATTKQDRLKVLAEVNARSFWGDGAGLV